MARVHFINIRVMRCIPMRMDARRRALPMVVPLAALDNAADAALGRNPKGRAVLAAGRRCSLLMWNDHIASVAPCPAARIVPSHTRIFMK